MLSVPPEAWKSQKGSVSENNAPYDQEAELIRNDKGWKFVLGKKTPRKQ